MGSQASKTAQSAARKFPSRAPGAVPPTSRPAGAPRPQGQSQATKASFTKDEAIRADAADPDPLMNPAFSQRLKQMGVATPTPTLSNSSIASSKTPPTRGSSPSGSSYPPAERNTTLGALEARQRMQEQGDSQLEDQAGGREFAEVGTLRQVLIMRQRGVAASDIERRFRLRSGVVAKIESKGAITPLS